MLKRFSVALLFLSIAWLFGCPSNFFPGAPFGLAVAQAASPTQILFDYDFTLANNTACSSTVTKNCVSGFAETIADSTGKVVAGPVAVALPATISTTGPTVGITTPFNVPAGLGVFSINIQVQYKDNAGVQQSGLTSGLTYNQTPGLALNVRVQ